MISRRALLAVPLAAPPILWARRLRAESFEDAVAALERRHGGRLGVAVLDTGSGRLRSHRVEERFPLCSTFKFLAAAFVLARVDRGEEKLDRRIAYGKADLVTYSPVTEKYAGEGMTVGAICEAAVTLSDNTAGNLMLDSFGGPGGLTDFLRGLGDPVTRLDRRETTLNEAKPGDPRDTTSPVAMLETMNKTLFGSALSAPSQAQLAAWLVAGKTGDKRLRAGVPKAWRVGDKTGSGGNNATNDVAVIWPLDKAPILVTAYYVGAAGSDDERNAVLAEVGRLAVSA